MLEVKTMSASLPLCPMVAEVPSLGSLPGRVQCCSPCRSVLASVQPSGVSSCCQVVSLLYLADGLLGSFKNVSVPVGLIGWGCLVSRSMSQCGAWAGLRWCGDCPWSHVYGLPLGWMVGSARTWPPSPLMSKPGPSRVPASFLIVVGV